ncbi:MAG: hypothetical protein HRU28_11170 [Rhizobiales bacterium]|nr:hypothetical protein [Hyphomicrobiales bacterium]
MSDIINIQKKLKASEDTTAALKAELKLEEGKTRAEKTKLLGDFLLTEFENNNSEAKLFIGEKLGNFISTGKGSAKDKNVKRALFGLTK